MLAINVLVQCCNYSSDGNGLRCLTKTLNASYLSVVFDKCENPCSRTS